VTEGHPLPAPETDLDRLASVNLNLLVPLMALLEERSVTRAAEKVGMSQPAMSHALGRMRRLFGDELVVRQGSAMELTAKASSLVAPLRQLLRQASGLLQPRPWDPATDPRTIKLAMTTSTAVVIAGEIARLVSERAPAATLRLVTSTAVPPDVFGDGTVDAALVSDIYDTKLPRERLYADRCVVIAGRDAPPGASALELITSLPHVVYDGLPMRGVPYSILDQQGVRHVIRETVSDYVLIPRLVSATGGVALHRSRVVEALATSLDLRVEEFPFPIQEFGVDVVWNPWFDDDPFQVWLRQLLADAAATLDASRRHMTS
jgi:DNA-binding transcriptional LysR family regulator